MARPVVIGGQFMGRRIELPCYWGLQTRNNQIVYGVIVALLLFGFPLAIVGLANGSPCWNQIVTPCQITNGCPKACSGYNSGDYDECSQCQKFCLDMGDMTCSVRKWMKYSAMGYSLCLLAVCLTCYFCCCSQPPGGSALPLGYGACSSELSSVVPGQLVFTYGSLPAVGIMQPTVPATVAVVPLAAPYSVPGFSHPAPPGMVGSVAPAAGAVPRPFGTSPVPTPQYAMGCPITFTPVVATAAAEPSTTDRQLHPTNPNRTSTTDGRSASSSGRQMQGPEGYVQLPENVEHAPLRVSHNLGSSKHD